MVSAKHTTPADHGQERVGDLTSSAGHANIDGSLHMYQQVGVCFVERKGAKATQIYTDLHEQTQMQKIQAITQM